jgi:threonine/homoserine/homoserine lactone efflux protein
MKLLAAAAGTILESVRCREAIDERSPMDLTTWLLYLAAAIGLSLSPGPNGLLALTHGALFGQRKTINTILGGAVGFVALIGLSLFGIGALLQSSVAWLTVLKWLGGAYLVYLGIQVWRSPPIQLEPRRATDVATAGELFRQGALSAVTNPKGLLFFAAFLPQFVDPSKSLFVQFVVMSATFAIVEIITEFALASTAHRLRPWLSRVGKQFNRACGGTFVAIGAALPLRG